MDASDYYKDLEINISNIEITFGSNYYSKIYDDEYYVLSDYQDMLNNEYNHEIDKGSEIYYYSKTQLLKMIKIFELFDIEIIYNDDNIYENIDIKLNDICKYTNLEINIWDEMKTLIEEAYTKSYTKIANSIYKKLPINIFSDKSDQYTYLIPFNLLSNKNSIMDIINDKEITELILEIGVINEKGLLSDDETYLNKKIDEHLDNLYNYYKNENLKNIISDRPHFYDYLNLGGIFLDKIKNDDFQEKYINNNLDFNGVDIVKNYLELKKHNLLTDNIIRKYDKKINTLIKKRKYKI